MVRPDKLKSAKAHFQKKFREAAKHLAPPDAGMELVSIKFRPVDARRQPNVFTFPWEYRTVWHDLSHLNRKIVDNRALGHYVGRYTYADGYRFLFAAHESGAELIAWLHTGTEIAIAASGTLIAANHALISAKKLIKAANRIGNLLRKAYEHSNRRQHRNIGALRIERRDRSGKQTIIGLMEISSAPAEPPAAKKIKLLSKSVPKKPSQSKAKKRVVKAAKSEKAKKLGGSP
jgi:hypothetical protein